MIHAHALDYIDAIHGTSHDKHVIRRFRDLLLNGSSSVLTAVPSGRLFQVGGSAFAFQLRVRCGLPGLLGVDPGKLAVDLASSDQGARNGRHDAARDAILEVGLYSDRVVRSEPHGIYKCHHGSDCALCR